ncbi:hypothetical protein JIG36_15035 [Actinoplanes sp. LDG1-06]|uniref:Leucine rich repeat variant n=1 Tax=Paractinoplanes ovalisporus TaxID=2810368 RepID=A0ABS2AAL6_9ACTN|nr:hypothetical protein [Actinoplanes ovalisporus]
MQRRLLATPDWRLRVRVIPHMRLTDDELGTLLTEVAELRPEDLLTPAEAFGELEFLTRHDPRLHAAAAVHPDPRIRLYAVWIPEHLPRLLTDPVDEVRRAAERQRDENSRLREPADLPSHHSHGFWWVLQQPLSRALVDQVLSDEQALYFVGPNPSTPPDVVESLLRHPSARVRRRLAERADLTGDQLLVLAADPDAGVRTRVSVHPGLTEEQRAGIDIDVTTVPEDGHYGPARTCPAHDQPRHGDSRTPSWEDALRWARSVNPLLRRRAARHPEVTPATDDPDLGVRVLTALHNPAAPPSLLVDCFLAHDGCGRVQLGAHPRFPVEGLARFADHDDPAVRRLAARDPQVDPQVVARLLGDPSRRVREAMSSCPQLPVDRILALLNDPDLAEHAAANPSLPIGRVYQP